MLYLAWIFLLLPMQALLNINLKFIIEYIALLILHPASELHKNYQAAKLVLFPNILVIIYFVLE